MNDALSTKVPVHTGDIAGGGSPALNEVSDYILTVRGRRVMLGVDLATLYGVTPKRLNEQVKRNQARFPDDFLIRLSLEEGRALIASRSQSATLKRGRNLKYAPYAFPETAVPNRRRTSNVCVAATNRGRESTGAPP